MVHVTEELLLLAYDDEKGVDNSYTSLDYGLAGGVLLDLALQQRTEVVDGRVVVVDSSPVGNAVLDDALAQLAAVPQPKEASSWMTKLYWRIGKRVRDGLVEQGVLRYKKGQWLGLIPYSQYQSADPMVEREVRQRLENAVKRGTADGPKTAALAGVAHALWMEKKALPAMSRSQARHALKEVARDTTGPSINASVNASHDAVNAAVAATMAAILAAGVASGS